MKKIGTLFVLLCLLCVGCQSQNDEAMVLVEGGSMVSDKSNYVHSSTKVANFYISKYEVTQKEWQDIMGSNPSAFIGDAMPVEKVDWYQSIEYCNKRSEKEGYDLYYRIDKNVKEGNNLNENDTNKWTVTINKAANGYRLPTELEWEYAASGGTKSKSYIYCGSNTVNNVAWTWKNAGEKVLEGAWNWTSIEGNHTKTKEVGKKQPNELGLYDMSGNVREWCFDWYGDQIGATKGAFRSSRGGGWIGDVPSCEISYRSKFDPNGIGEDQGLRVCRNE